MSRASFSDRQLKSLGDLDRDKDKRIAELEAALDRAISYCDAAIHQDGQYKDERPQLVRTLNIKYPE